MLVVVSAYIATTRLSLYEARVEQTRASTGDNVITRGRGLGRGRARLE